MFLASKVHISKATYELLKGREEFHLVSRGLITVKVRRFSRLHGSYLSKNGVTKCIFQGKGEVETFWLSTRNDINQLSIDGKLISTMLYEIQFSSMPK